MGFSDAATRPGTAELAGVKVGVPYAKYVEGIASVRARTSENVAAMASFLAAPDSDDLIGQALIADGG